MLLIREHEFEHLVDPSDLGYHGGGPLASAGPVIYPFLELAGGRIYYGDRSRSGRMALARGGSTKGMLDAFAGIKEPGDALRFARRFGVLGLCEHGWPATHNTDPAPRPWDGAPRPCQPCGWRDRRSPRDRWYGWDPVTRWLHYARQAKSLLLIAGELHGGKPAPLALWEEALEDDRDTPEWEETAATCRALSQRVDVGRIYLARILNDEWLRPSRVRPLFSWDADDRAPRLPVLIGGTFGLLGVQLALTIAQARLNRCDGCGDLYIRRLRTQTGRRNFCPACGTRVANKMHQQAFRDRQRTATAPAGLHGGGRSASQRKVRSRPASSNGAARAVASQSRRAEGRTSEQRTRGPRNP